MKSACLKVWLIFACFTIAAPGWSQQKRISGKITGEEDGKPLANVNITVKGRPNGVQSGENGEFTIAVASKDILQFSYIGYATQEIKVGELSFLQVILKTSISKMDEVVVVGYGKQSRRTLSGSVSSLDQNALKSTPSSNAATALQGTVTGLRIQQSTGQPGTTPSISFRGGTNFDGSGSPLIVLDGVIVPSLYGINMDDIESMDVLKDAASTAIYGARASNGVILVTTKKGKKGRTQVVYDYKQTQNYIRRNSLQYLTAAQYIHMNRIGIASRYQADLADGNTNAANTDKGQNTGAWGWAVNDNNSLPVAIYSTQLITNANRNLIGNPQWNLLVDPNPFIAGQMDSILFRSIDVKTVENMVLQRSVTRDHYLNFSGANDQGNFSLGLGIMKDNGIIVGSSLDRISMNFNGGLNIGKNLKVSLNTSAYSLKSVLPYSSPEGGAQGGLMQRIIGIAPTVRFTNDTSGAILPGPGINLAAGDYSIGNPQYFMNKVANNSNQQRFSGGLNIEYTILPTLKFLASGSGYLLYNNYNSFTMALQPSSVAPLNTARNASFSNYNDVQYSYNAFLQYDKDFGNHKVAVLGGGEFYDFKEHAFSGNAQGAPTDFIPWLYASAPPSVRNGVIFNPTSASSDFNTWDRLASVIGRINYSYSNKYLLTVNLRYDGTSRLADNRYGFFPGISAGWNMQNEHFFRNSIVSKYVSVLKPRISWGQNGSISPLGYYATALAYSPINSYDGSGGNYVPNFINTNLKWESATTANIGVDIGFLKNRISLIADYFVRNVYDKIAQLPISSQTGFSSFYTNLGQLQNRGVELELKAQVVKSRQPEGLNIDFSANFYTFKNFVKKLPYNGLPDNRQQTIQVWDPNHPGQLIQVGGLQEGKRVGLDEVWVPRYDGIYTVQGTLDKDVAVYNAFLPYRNKTLKFLGDARWHQVNQNDTIDSRQYVFVGRTTPNVLGGFSSSIRYRGFTLYAQFDYAFNFVILNNEKLRGLSQVQGSQNSTVDVLNTWSPSNTSGTLPRFYWANQGRNYAINASGTNPAANFWEKGDYLMLRELSLSYEVTPRLLKQVFYNKLRSLRVFVSGDNLAYFMGYSGNFPEVGGVDNGKFPLPRRFTMGINIAL